ncbi:MAG: TIGR03557 family F420-dependent LLM class oxidoreductase, partial [Chloroflexi bacterium]|nr:TIGR03557 family F420-dependent LLM class oxidoreductase [Chloroflexota bacterium]
MPEFGYALSCEEHRPGDLVRFAEMAEEAGFEFAMISDHYHPWTDRQGQSPFAWTVIGGIAQVTRQLRLGTGVTCPMMRYHPAIVAQAAATAAALMPGRFFLGVGTGENLNEHILGKGWPSAPVRQEMLEEAIAIIRLLWQGGEHSFDGAHYTVDHARVYTLPDEVPPLYVAAAGPRAAEIAGAQGDGLISVAPSAELVDAFTGSGGAGKPMYGQVSVCWAADEAAARKTAMEYWPTAAVPGELSQELPLPRHFEQAAQLVREEDVLSSVVCGPDVERHCEAFKKFLDAGIDHVYVHQIGPDQAGFFTFYEKEVLPALRR